MVKKSKSVLDTTERLNQKIKSLQVKLKEAKDFIEVIKTKNIDAFIIPQKKGLKVFTENDANKPYRILIEKMHEGAITINGGGTILYCNSAFANMVKLPLQKVVGSNLTKYLDNSSGEISEILHHIGRMKPFRKEIYVHPHTGRHIPVLMSLTTVMLDSNRVLSIILTDLTVHNRNRDALKHQAMQLKETNDELENVNKDLLSFTYVSSHDLQEPLRKIQNFISLLLMEERETLTNSGKNYLQRTYDTAMRMRSLIDDLLSYSQTKTSERKFEKLDLKIIVDEVRNDFDEMILTKKATIEASQLGEAVVIRFQFHQLLDNLVSNSLKFSDALIPLQITIKSKIEKGSKLNVDKLFSKIDYFHITYSDNGIGFDPKYKDRIFEVFQRLHGHDKYKGTGIGLAICKRIVENHKGVITATGEINKGARFDIYLPLSHNGEG